MSEPIDPRLPPSVEETIQNRSLGLIQTELGVLQTNFLMAQARNEALMSMRVLDLQMIEGLKLRALAAEDNVRILQEQLLAAQQKLVEAEHRSRKPSRKKVSP